MTITTVMSLIGIAYRLWNTGEMNLLCACRTAFRLGKALHLFMKSGLSLDEAKEILVRSLR